MKILIICTIDASFTDREEVLCERLSRELAELKCEVDVCYLPFKRDMLNASEQIFAHSLIDTTRADALITIGYPACFIPHKNEHKISYLFDCYPEIHDDFIFRLHEHKVDNRLKITKKITVSEENTFRNIKHIFVATDKLRNEINGRYNIVSSLLHPEDVNFTERVERALF